MKTMFHKAFCSLSSRVNPNPSSPIFHSPLHRSNNFIRFRTSITSSPSVCFSTSPDYDNDFNMCRAYYKNVRRSVSAVANAVSSLQSDLFVKGFCPVPNAIEKSKVHLLELNYVYRQLAEARYYYPRQYSNYCNGLLEVRQKTVGIVAFLHWLETGKLISMKEVDKKLGLRGPIISGEEGQLRFARSLARQQGMTITGSETLESVGVKQESGPDGSISFSFGQNLDEKIVENSGTEKEEEENEEEDGEEENNRIEDRDEGEEKDDKSLQCFRGFELDLEDYLIGICEMTEKMPEYVLHQLKLGDYECAKRVLQFLSDIQAVIRPLNPHIMYAHVDKTLLAMFQVAEQNLIRVEELCFDAEVLLRQKNEGIDDEQSK